MSLQNKISLSFLLLIAFSTSAMAQAASSGGDPLMPGIETGSMPPLPEPVAAPEPVQTMPAPAPAPTAATTLPTLPPIDNAAPAPPVDSASTVAPPIPPMDNQGPPTVPTTAAAAPDASHVIDQFFSDSKIISNQEKPAEPAKPEQKDASTIPLLNSDTPDKPKKSKIKAAPKPEYNFKSQILPPSIYKKAYSTANRHLPKAVSKEELAMKLEGVIAHGDLSDTKALVSYGFPVNTFLPTGETPLILATRYHQPLIMQWLLGQGARANDSDTNGYSALHYAAFSGTTEMVDMLLSYGANPNITDTRGYTPLVYADIRQSEGIKSVIRSFGGIDSVTAAPISSN